MIDLEQKQQGLVLTKQSVTDDVKCFEEIVKQATNVILYIAFVPRMHTSKFL